MDDSIIEKLKKAVTSAIRRGFSYPIYTEDVAGGKKDDCLTVSIKKTESKRLLANRKEMRITFLVTYIPKSSFFRKKITETSLGLHEVLAEIHWGKDRFLASKMEEDVVDGRLLFYVTYYLQIFVKESQEKMEYLEQRGDFLGKGDI